MAKYMTREEFFHILLRQRQSNLTVKDFCANEGYNRSQFYDWRSRFNISDEELKSGSVPTAGMDGFVPISIDTTMYLHQRFSPNLPCVRKRQRKLPVNVLTTRKYPWSFPTGLK